MEDSDGSEDVQSKAVIVDEKKSKPEPQNEEGRFNWKLPLFGAIGFGIGFAIRAAIMATIYDIATNFFADTFPGTGVGLEVGMMRGLIVGAIGGAGLALASKDKTDAFFFPLTGAIGFAFAFALVLLLAHYSFSDSGMGAIVGGIGGLALGLASSKGRIVASLWLGVTGAIWFAIAFAIGSSIFDGNLYSSWNVWGGAIGGATFGLTLALYYKTFA